MVQVLAHICFCANIYSMTKKTLTYIALCSLVIAGVFAMTQGKTLAAIQLITSYTPPATDSVQDFHIDKDGYVNLQQAKVYQISGTSFYARYYIGLAFVRVLIKTSPTTKVYRRFGDEIPLVQIGAGDVLNVSGKIETGADSLSLVADKIIDFSNQQEISDFKGTIVANGSIDGSFLMNTKTTGNIVITTGTTTQIRKGSRIIDSAHIHIGDQITDTTGTFDHSSNTLAANVIVVYIDMKQFTPKNFQGTLKAVLNPQTLTFTTGGKDYNVVLSGATQILNNKKNPALLQRFVVGDTIRIYGAIQESDDPIINAEIVRNIDL